MRKTLQTAAALLLAMVMTVSVLTVSAFAKSDKADKSSKSGKESSSAADSGFTAITLDQAKEIALGHAGADSADAVFSKAKLDKTVYELKFTVPGAKYEYEISTDGTIVSFEADIKNAHGTQNTPDNSPSYEVEITRDEARQIALEDAGLDQATLKYVVCYLSWSNHVPYAYEVKFSTRTTCYQYTIDLDTGAILNSICTPRP